METTHKLFEIQNMAESNDIDLEKAHYILCELTNNLCDDILNIDGLNIESAKQIYNNNRNDLLIWVDIIQDYLNKSRETNKEIIKELNMLR